MDAIQLHPKDFVRVKPDANFRAGQDGLVMSPPDADGFVGLTFHYDRYGNAIMSRGGTGEAYVTPCEGIELWHVGELDLSSVDR